MNEDTRSDKPYKLGDGSYTTLAELAAALAENHELAGEHIERGYVQKWIEEDLRDYDARIALDKLLEENVTELALFEFALRYAPQWTPMIEGLPVQAEFLDEYLPQLLKDDYVVCTQELANFAGSLYSWGVLTDERVSKGNAERCFSGRTRFLGSGSPDPRHLDRLFTGSSFHTMNGPTF